MGPGPGIEGLLGSSAAIVQAKDGLLEQGGESIQGTHFAHSFLSPLHQVIQMVFPVSFSLQNSRRGSPLHAQSLEQC